MHLDGTLQASETATVHLALADISTTSADHASFAAAVNAAIGARTDLSFDAGTGTLTYTGTGSPMPDLVINLGAVNDGLVEGPEQYTVSLSSPGSTTGANVVGSGSVTTTITDVGTATWSISGDTTSPKAPTRTTRCTWTARCRRAGRRPCIWRWPISAPPAPTMRASRRR